MFRFWRTITPNDVLVGSTVEISMINRWQFLTSVSTFANDFLEILGDLFPVGICVFETSNSASSSGINSLELTLSLPHTPQQAHYHLL